MHNKHSFIIYFNPFTGKFWMGGCEGGDVRERIERKKLVHISTTAHERVKPVFFHFFLLGKENNIWRK